MLLLPVAVGRDVNYVARVARFVEFSPIFRQLVHNLRRETRHDWPCPSLSGSPSCPYLSFGVFGFLQCVTEIFQTGRAETKQTRRQTCCESEMLWEKGPENFLRKLIKQIALCVNSQSWCDALAYLITGVVQRVLRNVLGQTQ